MKRFFITGTDTDCGKTHAACALLAYWNEKGVRAVGFKPVASGCRVEGGECISDDAEALAQFGAHASTRVFRFEPPVSPHIAAARAGVTLHAADIAASCTEAALPDTEVLLVEGAGGLMVPLNAHETWLNFLTLTEMPVILVVGMRLGCLNHALLTARVLQEEKIACLGWIANWIDRDMLEPEDNLKTLVQKMPFPLLGEIAFNGGLSVVPDAIVASL